MAQKIKLEITLTENIDDAEALETFKENLRRVLTNDEETGDEVSDVSDAVSEFTWLEE